MTDETNAAAAAATNTDAAAAAATSAASATIDPAVKATTDPAAAAAPAAFDFKSTVSTWAGEDKAKQNNLRYNSLDEALNALHETKTKIRQGLVKKGLGDNPTPEEIAEYRSLNNIPETHDDYLKDLPDGLVIGDEDKPIFDSFLKAIHGKNADPAVAREAIKWYYEFQQAEEAKLIEANSVAKTTAEDTLMAEWGADFPANKNLLTNIMSQMPKELTGDGDGPIYMATLEDGTQLMNSPHMLKWLTGLARELHMPTTQLNSGNDPTGVSVHSRIAELVKMSGNHDGPYWKGPDANKLQLELQSLNARVMAKG